MQLAAVLALALLSAIGGHAQTDQNGCLRLLGSVACPGFQHAYLSPGNLSNAFPFFSEVTDVRSFDAAALNYFSDPFQFRTTKFTNQLGCSNASTATIRYQRTVLCSMWVNEQWSTQCLSNYNGTSAATSQKMVCQQTCLQYSASEVAIVNSTAFCPGPDSTNGTREFQLNKDFTDCTDWKTLATNNSDSCVSGASNEGYCGFGTSTTEMCSFCSGANPDDCCYDSSIDTSICGFALPVRTSSTTSSSTPAATSGSLQDMGRDSSSGLSGGQIAGIVVGSVIGGLLLLGLLLLGLLCLRRRRRGNQGVSGRQPNTSEKGLLGTSTHAARSSPTMGGGTLYAGSGHAKSAESGFIGAGMAATGAAAAMAGTAGGERAGNVLPRVRDENQNAAKFIETGAEVTVLWPYQATLPDELDLQPGMKLRVLRLYDDAWGTGEIVQGGESADHGKQGAFPIVCVSEGTSFDMSSRGSSVSH
ncbi:hypothetical protein DB88DRAFT_346524 [Papiliotrema laurentii]|uniref:SH3 domain-containing protein n=1 Tax=Papiliotrema laurentii TaxID=5418 RepID=A0AAD9FNH5_PAPLA|nr:hypothetical protein DB88DRAFT_346524 [Papiliotrema laurentii]